MTDQPLKNVFQSHTYAHPHTPSVTSASHNIYSQDVRAPSPVIEWDVMPAHPHTPSVASASHNIYPHDVRAPSTAIEWDIPPDGVGSEPGNAFPAVFGKPPGSSSESSKKRRRRHRSRAKPQDMCKQLLAEPGSVGESELRPGCRDDTGPTPLLRDRDVAGTPVRLRSCESVVGRAGLLQSQIDSDKPIQLATPVVSLTRKPVLTENGASVFGVDKPSSGTERPLADPDYYVGKSGPRPNFKKIRNLRSTG
jgi:hypothetical protein